MQIPREAKWDASISRNATTNRYVRADTAVRPYAEFVNTTKIIFTDKLTNAMRGGMLSVRAGRRKWSHRQEW